MRSSFGTASELCQKMFTIGVTHVAPVCISLQVRPVHTATLASQVDGLSTISILLNCSISGPCFTEEATVQNGRALSASVATKQP